jgi:prolyl 4-hydroxylase
MTTKTPPQQQVSDDLLAWLQSQLDAGCLLDDLMTAMRSSGWDEAIARQALERVRPGSQLPLDMRPAGKLPEPALAEGARSVEVQGHTVQILMALRQPRIVVFGGLLTSEECDGLVEQARGRLTRSETVDNSTGGSEVNSARTSEGMFFQRGESPLIQRVENRIAALLQWPVRWGEGLQVLRYGPGAEYRPHHDYFDPKHAGTATVLKRGGQRLGTLVMYLNDPVRGGGTTFPDITLEVAAIKGNAVFFSYDRPHATTRTLHGGAPVVEGEKWVATKWLREREFH